MKLLLVEDDEDLAVGLKASLAQSGHAVNHQSTGERALAVSLSAEYDVVILDLGLPDIDGISALRRMRESGVKTPVLILTARDGLNEKVNGLDAGADDYLGKPFELEELEARIRALSRRKQPQDDQIIRFGLVWFDNAERQLYVKNATLNLTAREVAVVEALIRRPGRIVNKERIFESIYDIDSEASTAAIEVYVSRIRKKLEAADAGVNIRVVRGLGYRLELCEMTSADMNTLAPQSLRRRLLIRLSIPLLALVFFGATLAVASARYYAALVHDQWLYDSAMSLASQINWADGKITVKLPAAAVEILEWDRSDRIFYDVYTPSDGHIFGNATIPPISRSRLNEPYYYDGIIDSLHVRIAAVELSGPDGSTEHALVQVAETLSKRDSVERSIMLATIPLAAGLLFLAGLFIWVAIGSALRTLNALSSQLEHLNIDHLAPLEVGLAPPTEVQPLVTAVNSLMQRLGTAYDAQRRFVANAAHQLRTPLATLQVQTERALREADPVQQSEALSAIRQAMVRLKHLIQQLLSLARAEPGAGEGLEMVKVDLAILLREELDWADAAIRNRVDLGYEGPNEGVFVRGQKDLLRELIANLVDNAIRYGRAGATVTARLTHQPLSLSIEDDGPGIPIAERTRVTERFYRIASHSGDGSGLGLAIAVEIASRHGAALVISTPRSGRGTIVSVEFSGETKKVS